LEVTPHGTTVAVLGITVEVVLARTWYCMQSVVLPPKEETEISRVCTGE
jgi:hypothetical protein